MAGGNVVAEFRLSGKRVVRGSVEVSEDKRVSD